jgi:hypothetical protein
LEARGGTDWTVIVPRRVTAIAARFWQDASLKYTDCCYPKIKAGISAPGSALGQPVDIVASASFA